MLGAVPETADYSAIFPERVFIGEREPEVIGKRMNRLGKWLASVLRLPAVRANPTLLTFLGAGTHAPCGRGWQCSNA